MQACWDVESSDASVQQQLRGGSHHGSILKGITVNRSLRPLAITASVLAACALFITIYLVVANTDKPPAAAHVLAGPAAREQAKMTRERERLPSMDKSADMIAAQEAAELAQINAWQKRHAGSKKEPGH